MDSLSLPKKMQRSATAERGKLTRGLGCGAGGAASPSPPCIDRQADKSDLSQTEACRPQASRAIHCFRAQFWTRTCSAGGAAGGAPSPGKKRDRSAITKNPPLRVTARCLFLCLYPHTALPLHPVHSKPLQIMEGFPSWKQGGGWGRLGDPLGLFDDFCGFSN